MFMGIGRVFRRECQGIFAAFLVVIPGEKEQFELVLLAGEGDLVGTRVNMHGNERQDLMGACKRSRDGPLKRRDIVHCSNRQSNTEAFTLHLYIQHVTKLIQNELWF